MAPFGPWSRARRAPSPSSSAVQERMRQCTAGPDGRDPARPGAPLAGAVLVGGAVRDVLLGRMPSDVDWLVPEPEAAARALADAWGASLVALDPDRGHWRVVVGGPGAPVDDGAGAEEAPSAGPGARTWDLAAPRAASVEDDLRHRDLTVNALAWRPSDGALLDPTGGVADLHARRVRLAGPDALHDDPLRAWRVVRVAAQLGFRVERGTRAAVVEAAAALADGTLPRPAPERVGAELDALLATPVAGRAVHALDDLGLLALDLPELTAGREVRQGPLHHLDVLDHQVEALHRLVQAFPDADLALRWATLLHDVGKPPTREPGAVGPDGLVLRDRFTGHDRVGADLAAAALERLRRPRARIARVHALIAAHMRPLPDDERGARRFVHRLRTLLPDLLQLMLADREAARGRGARAAARRGYRERVGRVLAVLDATPPAPPLLDGRDVMATLGLTPGPQVGAVLAAVAEAQALGEVGDRAAALAYARAFVQARDGSDRAAPP
ncbi:MAG: HD domain-containing protein [Trueperaceae bacterium]|nr:HD domain-containing protein [Trueperaceae bacterium]